MALGTRVHAAIEARLADETAPIDVDVARIIGPALPWLHSLDVVHVEESWERTIEGIDFQGTTDLVIDGPIVIDHKTSSNPAKYGHTPETLALDPQASLYAHVWDAKRVVWSYMATKGRPRHRLVEAEPAPVSAVVLPVAREILRALDSGVPAHKQPANPGSCRAYGRPCPHIARCTDIRPSMTGRTVDMSIEELLKKARETNTGATTATDTDAADTDTPTIAYPTEVSPPDEQLNPDLPPPSRSPGAHHRGRVLYEGCVPIGDIAHTDAMSIALEADRMVSVGHSVPSYKAIRFGEGPAHLLAAARELLSDRHAPIVVYASAAAIVCDIMPALIEWADVHIRSMR